MSDRDRPPHTTRPGAATGRRTGSAPWSARDGRRAAVAGTMGPVDLARVLRRWWSGGTAGTALRVVSLVLLDWVVATETGVGLAGRHLAAVVLLVVATAGWLGWWVLRDRPDRAAVGPVGPVRLAGLGAMAVAGALLADRAPTALVYLAVAGLAAGSGLALPGALAMTTLGPAVLAIAGLSSGRPASLVVGGLAAGLGGMVLGLGRRQAVEHAAQASAVALERERAELAGERAVVLDERNRLAREIHDVLAHTLGALSVQLEAVDSVLHDAWRPSADDRLDAARHALSGTKRLVAEGLQEARQAVRALRDDTPALDDRLRRLCERDGAHLTVTGTPHPLAAEPALALWRAAQEGVTNARKHAPGAPVRLGLAFADGRVRLTVDNGVPTAPAGPLGASGGGYGLQGMRERVLLLGGRVEAGPDDGGGWHLAVEVPA